MPTTPSNSAASQQRTFAFVDLAGFTALTEAHGDEQAVDLIDTFVVMTRASLGLTGQLVKCLGDAVMLCFERPSDALSSIADLLQHCQATDDFPIPRTGIHHGPAIQRNGDWYGGSVNLAARVAAQAHGGQTLSTTVVAAAFRAQGRIPVSLGCFELRNIAERVELFDLKLSAPIESSSVDPVCRMQVRHATAVGRLRYAGEDFWFCSLDCVHKFSASPSGYNTPQAAG